MFNSFAIGLMGQAAATLPQAAPAIQETTSENHHIMHLIFNADPVVQFTLFVLLVFSVVSWAIIIAKHKQLKHSVQKIQQFYQLFWDTKKMDEIGIKKGGTRTGPAFHIFLAAQQALDSHKGALRKEPVEREVRRSFEDEIDNMEYGIPFLATTASAAPFIGLFGTVWGILNAFWKIGQSGSSSLSIVGPHIAEALIATAIGLAAAIPAVIFYNLYVNKIRKTSKDLADFTDDLIERVDQEYFGTR
ncbi:MAG: MotA/TolQ/ExbB proton channel family protein [Deltaproteobacteria bacterium]|nr:MotA/TolQ/ExbB proton channel family protein [Deltaproteobacteria bacterium]